VSVATYLLVIDVEVVRNTKQVAVVLAIGAAVVRESDGSVEWVLERSAPKEASKDSTSVTDKFWADGSNRDALVYLNDLQHSSSFTERDLLASFSSSLAAMAATYQPVDKTRRLLIVVDEIETDVSFLKKRISDHGLPDPFEPIFGSFYHVYSSKDLTIGALFCTSKEQHQSLGTPDIIQRTNTEFERMKQLAQRYRLERYSCTDALESHPGHKVHQTHHHRQHHYGMTTAPNKKFLRHTPLYDVLRTINLLNKIKYIQSITNSLIAMIDRHSSAAVLPSASTASISSVASVASVSSVASAASLPASSSSVLAVSSASASVVLSTTTASICL
jgi:hypothetical protein